MGSRIRQTPNRQSHVGSKIRQTPNRQTHAGSYAGVQPAGVVVVASEGLMLDHVSGVIHTGTDLAPDLDLLQSHHHGPDSALTPVPLCKQVPKLHSHTRA